MKTFKQLTEAKNSSAVFTFGRFNPPTTGHEKLIDAVARQHAKNAGSEMYVYASHSNDPKKNPLPHAKKIAYMRAMFPKYKRNILSDKDRNVFEIATSLYNKGYRSVVMVVGSDRVNEFKSLLNKYNDSEGRHGYYNFNNIEVVSAGERDPDADGVEGMSASKMRAASVEGDYDTFELGLPKGFKHGLKLFRDIRSNMGIREERNMGKMTDHEELRDAYLVGKIWNIGDLVEVNGVEGNVVNRGTNYLAFCDRDGKVHKAWLHDIVAKRQNYKEEYETNPSDMEPFNEVKQDSDIKDKEGTQPAKYHSGLDPETKKKRDAHFKAKKDGPAPGDADAKTKPSVHTLKYKQMFGERELTDKEKDDKEHNVKKLKKHLDTFKDRYGKDGEGVMYAIATRDAKKEKRYKEEVQLDEKIEGLINKAEKSGISYSILKKVYDRGMAAWKTGHRPGTTPQQWAFARVNSFITKGKGTWGKADADLARKVEMVESVKLNEWDEIEEEAEYQGKKVKLNNPMKGDIKKTKVYVRNDKGNVVKVEFGDPNMEIKRDDPARRKSFRARHNCDNPGPKWKARYWSCKFWEKGKSVTDLMKG